MPINVASMAARMIRRGFIVVRDWCSQLEGQESCSTALCLRRIRCDSSVCSSNSNQTIREFAFLVGMDGVGVYLCGVWAGAIKRPQFCVAAGTGRKTFPFPGPAHGDFRMKADKTILTARRTQVETGFSGE